MALNYNVYALALRQVYLVCVQLVVKSQMISFLKLLIEMGLLGVNNMCKM